MDENKLGHVGHEEGDVDALTIGKSAIALTLICIVSLALLFGLFKYYLASEGGEVATLAKFPPSPQLQMTPAADLKAIRAVEEQALTSYGWVDQQKGIVRLPISRAIDLLAQRGLPSRPPAEAQAYSRGVSAPTESGLGTKIVPEEKK
jgi:hypothetical protein